MEALKRLDRVAYIRYASIYRDFADIDNFREEIESLMNTRESRTPSAQLPLLPDEKPMPQELRRRRRPRRPRGSLAALTTNDRDEGETPDTPENQKG
jgi:hypothetical protein